MRNCELAEWFGIKPKTFNQTDTKKAKLKILHTYAEFTEVYGGVIITAIKFDEYSKAREIVEQKAEEKWKPGEWHTAKEISNEIYSEDKRVSEAILPQTCDNYVGSWKRDNYGVSYVRDGSKGSCLTKIVKIDENGKQVEMTPEETKIKIALIKKYFGTDEEKEYIIMSEYKQKEITAEEAMETLIEIKGYNQANIEKFKKELHEKIGPNVKGTSLRPGIYEYTCAFE